MAALMALVSTRITPLSSPRHIWKVPEHGVALPHSFLSTSGTFARCNAHTRTGKHSSKGAGFCRTVCAYLLDSHSVSEGIHLGERHPLPLCQ